MRDRTEKCPAQAKEGQRVSAMTAAGSQKPEYKDEDERFAVLSKAPERDSHFGYDY